MIDGNEPRVKRRSVVVGVAIAGAFFALVVVVGMVLTFTTGELHITSGDLEIAKITTNWTVLDNFNGPPTNSTPLEKLTHWFTRKSKFPIPHHTMNYFFAEMFACYALRNFKANDIIVGTGFVMLVIAFAAVWESLEKFTTFSLQLTLYIDAFKSSFIRTVAMLLGTGEDKWNPPLNDIPQGFFTGLGKWFLIHTGTTKGIGFILKKRKVAGIIALLAWMGFSKATAGALVLNVKYGSIVVPYGVFVFFASQFFFLCVMLGIDVYVRQKILSRYEVVKTYVETGVYLLVQLVIALIIPDLPRLVSTNIAFLIFIVLLISIKEIRKRYSSS